MIIMGRNEQINCTEDTFYKLLGYIANHPNDVKIVFENNSVQGAWGNEGRVHFYSNFASNYFKGISFTAGVGNVINRLNCNEFFDYIKTLGYVEGSGQKLNQIRPNIPSQHLSSFDIGVSLP